MNINYEIENSLKKLTLFYLFFIFFLPNVLFADTKVYFSPNGGCQDAVISEIHTAQNTVDIAMYFLTSREIAQELVKAKERKVTVRIVLDQGQETQNYSKSRYLIKRGFEVKYHIGPGIMHNKFALIDGKVLLTGSFNWTPTANEKNEENLLIITDKDLIKKYEERFEYLWKSSRKGSVSQDQTNEE